MVYLTWLYTPLNLHETSLNYIKHLCPPGISPRMGRGSYDYLLDPPCQRWVVKKLGVITRKISKTNCTPQHESLCHYVHCFFNIPALQGNKQCCYHKNKPCRACGMIASLAQTILTHQFSMSTHFWGYSTLSVLVHLCIHPIKIHNSSRNTTSSRTVNGISLPAKSAQRISNWASCYGTVQHKWIQTVTVGA